MMASPIIESSPVAGHSIGHGQWESSDMKFDSPFKNSSQEDIEEHCPERSNTGIDKNGDMQDNNEEEPFYDCNPMDSVRSGDCDAAVTKATTNQTDLLSDDDGKLPCRAYARLMRNPCCAPFLKRFPRTCAVLCGVVFPLWVLVFVSLGFGSILCEQEAPPEISNNDASLEQRYFTNFSSSLILNLTMVLPRVCTIAFLSKGNSTLESSETDAAALLAPLLNYDLAKGHSVLPKLLLPHEGYDYPDSFPTAFDPETRVINSTELYLFMSECGESLQEAISSLLATTIRDSIKAANSLTFNWIRCYEGADGGTRDFNGGQLSAQERSMQGQSRVYVESWEEDRQSLYQDYYQAMIDSGVDPTTAWVNATTAAAKDATGGSVCVLNAPAAAWFWFTVQTTVREIAISY